jgi:hypothetical protein
MSTRAVKNCGAAALAPERCCRSGCMQGMMMEWGGGVEILMKQDFGISFLIFRLSVFNGSVAF